MKQQKAARASFDPKYDVNLGNVKKWRSQSEWGEEETRRLWYLRNRGQQQARNFQVDFPVRIYEIWRALMHVVIAAVICAFFFVAYRVTEAFLTGRVQMVLDEIQRNH